MTPSYTLPRLPLPYNLETIAVLKQLNLANRALAELKGIANTIPNENILISTLTLQEAKDSSEVENIVTTQDELYKADINVQQGISNASAKEVINYREALRHGFALVKKDKLLTTNMIQKIQEKLESNRAGFRKLPGTSLQRSNGEIVYTPPQDIDTIMDLMGNLENFINTPEVCATDPLIKMAIIHHQFESIHPFYDGNGRTSRIINVLYLVINDLLDLPILYLSRYITRHKADYYRLIQAIRDKNNDNAKEWENWVLFMLKAIENTAQETIHLVKGISALMNEYKQILRPLFGKQYKHELLNNIFFHPYTKIDFLAKEIMSSRQTAAKHLSRMVEQGLLQKWHVGRENYYVNTALVELFVNRGDLQNNSIPSSLEPQKG